MLSVEIHNKGESFFANGNDHPDWKVNRVEKPITDKDVVDRVRKAIYEGYVRIIVQLEDTILVVPEPGKLVAFDMLSGKRRTAYPNQDELFAILALGIGGDEIENAKEYCVLAEEVIKHWPNEIRPIP